MRLDILTLFPNMMTMFFEESILKRAQKKGLVEVVFHDLHDYSLTRYGSVDDYPYGGAAGMVMGVEPLANCIEGLQKERHYDEVIYTAPDGEMLSQPMANQLSLAQNLMVLCGHYKGVDERVREHFITKEISIGDYVLTGGELATAVICDAVIRLVPGVIGDEQSALGDSFQDGLELFYSLNLQLNFLLFPLNRNLHVYKNFYPPSKLLHLSYTSVFHLLIHTHNEKFEMS